MRLLLLMLLSSSCFGQLTAEQWAGNLVFSYIPPTAREDGSELVFADIAKYSIAWTCDTGKHGVYEILNPTLTSVSLPISMVGRCAFAMRTTDTGGRVSAPSKPVVVFIKLPKPARGGFK